MIISMYATIQQAFCSKVDMQLRKQVKLPPECSGFSFKCDR